MLARLALEERKGELVLRLSQRKALPFPRAVLAPLESTNYTTTLVFSVFIEFRGKRRSWFALGRRSLKQTSFRLLAIPEKEGCSCQFFYKLVNSWYTLVFAHSGSICTRTKGRPCHLYGSEKFTQDFYSLHTHSRLTQLQTFSYRAWLQCTRKETWY